MIPAEKQSFIITKDKVTLSKIRLFCICQRGLTHEEYVTCQTCSMNQHLSCISENSKMATYECPNCQYKNFNYFFTNIENIVPTRLIPHSLKDQEYYIDFKINETQRGLLSKPSEPTALRCFIIRCIRIDSKGYEHHWPMNSTIEIFENNGQYGGKHVISSQTYIWKKTPPRAHPRVDFPICYELKGEVTNNLYHFYMKDNYDDIGKIKLNRDYTIKLKNQFLLNTDDKYSYAISVDIVEINRNMDTIMKGIKSYSEPNQLKLLMKKNEDISLYEKISFICQYSAKRIFIPCRGYDCLHLQVFDLINYLQIQSVENKSEKTWKCPVCKKKAVKLYIDGFVKKVIENNPTQNETNVYNKDFKYQFTPIIETKEKNEATSIAIEDTREINQVYHISDLKVGNEPKNHNRQIYELNDKKGSVIRLSDSEEFNKKQGIYNKYNINNLSANDISMLNQSRGFNLNSSNSIELDTEEFNRILASSNAQIDGGYSKNPLSKNTIISNNPNISAMGEDVTFEPLSFNNSMGSVDNNTPIRKISIDKKDILPIPYTKGKRAESQAEELNRCYREKYNTISDEVMNRNFMKMIDHYRVQNKFDYVSDFDILGKKLNELN